MRAFGRSLIACALVAIALFAPRRAVGDPVPTNADRREALKLAGLAMDLYAAGDYEAALEEFTRADALVPAPTLELRIARCLDRLDRMLEAAERYREVIAYELTKSSPPQYHEARKEAVPELAALLEQIPVVVVVVAGAGSGEAIVLLEGSPLPRGVIGEEQRLDPGSYTLAARSGERRVQKTVILERGKRVRVELTLPPAEGLPPLPPPEMDDGGRAVRILGWTVVGLGGAALSLGSIAGAVLLSREEELLERCPDRQCPPSEHDAAREFDTLRFLTTGGLVAGGVAAAAGVTMVLLAPADDEAQAQVVPLLWPGGLGVRGHF